MTGDPGLRALREAVARLEAAAATLPLPRPGQESLGEEVCDRLIDLAAARAAVARTAAGADVPDEASGLVTECVRWAVEDDAVRTRSRTASPAQDGLSLEAAHGLVTRLITALAAPECYDAVGDRLRAQLGGRPEGRAAGAWDIADEALRGLAAVRPEWVGGDPAHTAAGGWVLVDRVARLRLTAVLLAEAAARGGTEAEHLVNAARRHAWNWLRLPPPEAATAVHVRRTGELMAWIGAAGSVSAEPVSAGSVSGESGAADSGRAGEGVA
ncbi:hypothetical protein JL475_21420 [Streptomyces sp. M2CJ-2]|uniref:hypothetical protein n=1 Tax=Streptomyces sp. M2CJ-2 TaxID=2803948 RepID=UPI0019257685|nr:hypothetical protein [Streptomyces sp. M2CJ-2]MBL3668505.1 hypothetical protein [Streptomyces sp. M2CJ-2]